ncbi:hypothetical protein NESM_000051700 [Novymonas esmeraldas]|uniref:Proteophosphoglycan ppg4 n=1 Tax=Novymonas esmeraldas TaxID=1808958 RepID=A0AAW0F1G3_9TRYP
MPRRRFSSSPASDGGSATVVEDAVCSSEAPPVGHRATKQIRHVAFFLEREVNETETESVPRATWACRRGCASASASERGVEEHASWSRRAEADALRQRALQCGEDFARVASGLGYEVVAHTPTAFVRRASMETAAAPTAVPKPERTSPGGSYAAAKGAPSRTDGEAMSHSPPAAAAFPVASAAHFGSRRSPTRLHDSGEPDSTSSSRSSSPGTEAQVGMVPVLSPLLPGSDPAQRRLSADAPLRLPDSQVPRITGPLAGANRYPASAFSVQDGLANWALDGDGGRTSPPRSLRHTVAVDRRSDHGANQTVPTAVNSTQAVLSTPTTAHAPPSNASPSPHPALTSRAVTVNRHPPSTTVPMSAAPLSNAFAFRLSMMDVTSSRATSNANASLSTEHLNGGEVASGGATQSTNNRFFTPSTDALNTPAVRMADDEDWPRTLSRSIQ